MASDYDGLTVADLKELLRERQLPVSGTKGVLLARLEEFDARSAEATQPSEGASETTSIYDALRVKEEKVNFKCRVCGCCLQYLLAIRERWNALLAKRSNLCPSPQHPASDSRLI